MITPPLLQKILWSPTPAHRKKSLRPTLVIKSDGFLWFIRVMFFLMKKYIDSKEPANIANLVSLLWQEQLKQISSVYS